jgi:uncharacterized protein YbaR (Trm112 family)
MSNADQPNARNPRFDSGVFSGLACPACHGELRLGEETIVCGSCGRAYPIFDGIPVLIAERAIVPGP